MNPLDRIMGTEEAAKVWGLSQDHIKRLCREGKVKSVQIGRTWMIDRDQPNPSQTERTENWHVNTNQMEVSKMSMRSWESMKDVFFEDMTLVHAGYGNDKNFWLDNNKVSLFYVNQTSLDKTPNHFAVTWDFSDFLSSEQNGSFEWPSPHAVMSINEDRKKQTIKYFSGTDFTPYGREVEFNGQTLSIINRPVEFAKSTGKLRYYAGATDQEGNVYQVYWNLFNMFEPSEVTMTVDNGRYCKRCLKRWMPDTDTTNCNHEWVYDSE